jgi:hypothetical protein
MIYIMLCYFCTCSSGYCKAFGPNHPKSRSKSSSSSWPFDFESCPAGKPGSAAVKAAQWCLFTSHQSGLLAIFSDITKG